MATPSSTPSTLNLTSEHTFQKPPAHLLTTGCGAICGDSSQKEQLDARKEPGYRPISGRKGGWEGARATPSVGSLAPSQAQVKARQAAQTRPGWGPRWGGVGSFASMPAETQEMPSVCPSPAPPVADTWNPLWLSLSGHHAKPSSLLTGLILTSIVRTSYHDSPPFYRWEQ